MREALISFSGWIPALTLPTATLFQLARIVKTGSAEGVSALTWLLFGFANLGIYVFTEKYLALQSILAQLLTAVLNFVIVGFILAMRRKKMFQPRIHRDQNG